MSVSFYYVVESLYFCIFKRSFMAKESKGGAAKDLGLETDKQLRKVLGKWELLYLSLGGIIGSGWLFGSLYAGAYAGGAAIISWIIAGILVLFIGLAYSEIGSAIPKSGAIVRYPHYTHGGLVGYLLAWAYFLSAASVAPIEATAAVTYLSYFFHPLTVSGVLTPLGYALAYVLLVLFTILNYFGAKAVGLVSHIAGWWKLIIPTVTIVLLIALYFHPSNLTAGGGFFPSASLTASGFSGFAAVLYAIPTTGVIFAYLGFRQSVDYGGEGRNPRKDIPFAVIGSLLIALVIYTLLQIAFTGAINWKAAWYVNSSGVPVFPLAVGNWSGLAHSNYTTGPFYAEFVHASVFGPVLALFSIWAIILLIDAVISPSGTGWIYIGTTTRVIYGFAADGYLPSAFLKLGKTKIPIWSLIASLIIGAIFLIPFPSWISLVGFISSATVFTYIMGGIALTGLRRVAPDLKRPYKLSGASIIAPLATMAAGLIVYWSGFTTLFYLFTAIFVGLPIFFGFYALKELKLNKALAATLGIVDIVITLALAFLFYGATSGLTAANNLWFAIYYIVMAALVFGNIFALLKLVKSEDVKNEIKAGVWLPVYMFVMYLLSYFGAFGLYTVIPFPYDTIAAAAITIGFHYWASYSTIRTKALDEIIETAVKEGV